MTELRRFLRASKPYRVEYGPFPLTGSGGGLKESVIQNIGAGGLMFLAPEQFPEGRQLVIRIHITGWRTEGDDIVESAEQDAVAPITAIAEVKRCEPDASPGWHRVGVEFRGRILG